MVSLVALIEHFQKVLIPNFRQKMKSQIDAFWKTVPKFAKPFPQVVVYFNLKIRLLQIGTEEKV